MNGWWQVITRVKFKCKAATQSTTSRYTSNFNKRCRLTSEEPVNLRGIQDANSGPLVPHTKKLPTTLRPTPTPIKRDHGSHFFPHCVRQPIYINQCVLFYFYFIMLMWTIKTHGYGYGTWQQAVPTWCSGRPPLCGVGMLLKDLSGRGILSN